MEITRYVPINMYHEDITLSHSTICKHEDNYKESLDRLHIHEVKQFAERIISKSICINVNMTKIVSRGCSLGEL